MKIASVSQEASAYFEGDRSSNRDMKGETVVNTNEIIDIEPTEISRGNSGEEKVQTPSNPVPDSEQSTHAVHSTVYPHTSGTSQGTTERTYTMPSSERPSSTKRPGTLSALIRIAIGVLLILIGVPMLILPGPGLLAICAGVALLAFGLRALLRSLKPVQTKKENTVI